MQDLTNRIALVTGASRGIGAGIALALAKAGAHVAVNCREKVAAARAVCRQISDCGRKTCLVQADVSSGADVQRMIDKVEKELGPIDILVNNAGISRPQKLDEITENDWNEVLAVNLTSVFLVSRAVVSGMRQRKWGRIVNLSSVAAKTGGLIGPHYTASKAGVIGLTRSYASLLASEGITVNAIAPALIETDMTAGLPNATPSRIPMGHFGAVEDVAAVAVMLSQNDYMTGQTVFVSGGWYMG